MWAATRGCEYDLVCGVPYTALPIATCLSLTYNIPLIMRRKEKKDYGTRQMIEGEFKSGQRCLIVEDIITTGSSIIETAIELENAGVTITDVVAVVEREQGGRENLEKNYKLHTILSLSDILTTLLQSSLLPAAQHPVVEQLLLERSK
jgi:uridine monophosphate synthetase